jgi:CDP-diacylglycerol---glycerol-3-phosphate 3-phosphatidyltransferase
MNLAHVLTFSRIFLIPFFPLIYLEYDFFGISFLYVPYILLSILLVCEFTDLMDGMVARKTNTVTDLGKILDPMADSITRICVFFTFTKGWVSAPLLLVLIFLYREFIITTLRTLCAMRGIALAARKSGKIKAVVQAVVNILIVLLMIPFSRGYISLETLRVVSISSIAVAAAFAIGSAVEYLYYNRINVRQFLVR